VEGGATAATHQIAMYIFDHKKHDKKEQATVNA
jgi:hypothetical protein